MVICRSICLAMFRLIFVLVIVAGKLVYNIGRDKELIFRLSRAISQGVTTVATTTTAAAVPDSVAIYCPPRLQNDIIFIMILQLGNKLSKWGMLDQRISEVRWGWPPGWVFMGFLDGCNWPPTLGGYETSKSGKLCDNQITSLMFFSLSLSTIYYI